MSSRGGWDFANLISAFSESGYALWWQVLNAKDFGVPQNRERVFVVGYFGNECPKEVFFEPQANGKDIQNLTPENSQHYRTYSTGGVAPTLQSQSGWSSQKHPFIYQKARGKNKGGNHTISPTVSSHSFQDNNYVLQTGNKRK